MSERNPLRWEFLRGTEIAPVLEELGMLRIRVFREYPYLYDGSLEYEQKYLQYYAANPDGMVILLRDTDNQVVGAATGQPAKGNWADNSLKVFGDDAYYWGELILDRPYRKRGIGNDLYKQMLAKIHELGYTKIGIYMIVTRPDDPLRPSDYLEISDFAHNHGYRKIPGATEEWSWKHIGDTEETPHTLQAWIN